MTIFRNTVRGGLVLAALASGCGDDDRGSDSGRVDAGGDARAMLEAGAFDTGSMLDVGGDSAMRDATMDAMRDATTDTSSDTPPEDSALRAALRAVCMKLNECNPSSTPDVEACVDETIGYYESFPADCRDVYAPYLECIYSVECGVLDDEAMFDAHITTACSEEVAAVEAACD